MSTTDIVQKLWNLCNVLRDDGITYHQYVTELTYILFLKMMKETGEEENFKKKVEEDYQKKLLLHAKKNKKTIENLSEQEKSNLRTIVHDYSWDYFATLQGLELKNYYHDLLNALGDCGDARVSAIYQRSVSSIEEPKNIKKLVTEINGLDWFDAREEGLGDLYEGLLEKNANEKKSGAGQYFTPRVLIDIMTELINPQVGEKCFDPACGTFGFMISANQHVKDNNNYFALEEADSNFQINHAFSGTELVLETHRLALMNAYLHGLNGNIHLGDTLSSNMKSYKDFDVILSNPPFGTKKGGERATRDDISFMTSNKQLNFLQVIYRSLKANGKSRCAVILPDNVLFAGGEGTNVRKELMNFCDLHTILRLPTGIFYAQGVKTNVLFFTRGIKETSNTTNVTFYDMRNEMDNFGKTRTLKKSDFQEFMQGYQNSDNQTGERWKTYSLEDIKANEYSLDLGLMKDNSIKEYSDLADPIQSGEEMIDNLEIAIDLIKSVVKELKSLESK